MKAWHGAQQIGQRALGRWSLKSKKLTTGVPPVTTSLVPDNNYKYFEDI